MNALRATDVRRPSTWWWPWLLAAAGFSFDLAAWWPGLMSFDSAYAWWQARGGASTDITAPVLVWIWRLCAHFSDGPGLPFALHLALFWAGLALLARALRLTPLATLATLAVVGLMPVPLLLRAHVWTDVGLFSALTLASAALACAQVHQQRRWLWLALPLLLYATALRHNALPAIVPLAAWCAGLLVRTPADRDLATARLPRARRSLLWKRASVTAALLALLVLGAQAIGASVERRVPMWPSLAQYDLAAVSIATRRMWLPDFMIGPGMEIDDLAQAFRPWSNIPMLQNTRHGMRDPLTPGFSATELSALRGLWFGAVTGEPRAWLAHRARLSRGLFGTHAADWPVELIYVDTPVQYQDNPPLTRNQRPLHAGLIRLATTFRATPLLAAWPYLLLGLLALPAAWSRRHTPAGRSALLLLASAWLYALPLTLLAPSAELRYLGWPCVASLLAGVCAWMTPRAVSRC